MVVQAIARQLCQRGHKVTVLTVSYDDRRLGKIEAPDGVEVIYLRPVFRHRTLALVPGAIPFSVRRLRQFDIVHIYGMYELLGPLVAFFCRRWNIPFVVETLGMNRPVLRSLGKKRIYHALLGRRLMDQADRIISTSARERTTMLEDGVPEDTLVVRRNGVDLDEFRTLPARGKFRKAYRIRAADRVVLFLGRLVSVKSLDMLLEAAATLSDSTSKVVLAGPEQGDGYRKFLEKSAADLNLNGRVLFTGPLYGRDKLEALVDADVFVLPSLSENFGNAAVEAMACGTPVVVTEGCGVAPYLAGRGGLVIRHHVDALREALERLLGDRELLSRLRSQAPAVAGELSWDEPVDQMETLYQELVASRSSESGG